MPGHEFFEVTAVVLYMGVYGKEVEEKIFKNEYVFSICQESGLQTEKHFLHL